MEYLPFVFFGIMGLMAAYRAGQWSKEYPSNEEMLERLISARASRKSIMIAEESLEAEIEAKSTQRAAT